MALTWIDSRSDLRRPTPPKEEIVILCDPNTGIHVATTATHRAYCFLVDAVNGCSCQDYRERGSCAHHRMLLEELGLIDGPSQNEYVCPHCDGDGSYTLGHGTGAYEVACGCVMAGRWR